MKKKIVFLTGAGMSVESGFKTFRGSDGLWENYPVERVATHEAWEQDPEFVTKFYNQLRRKLYDAQPCEGHRLIAQMEQDYDVTVVTQNVDNLHEKGGSTNVVHLHGELTKVCSSRDPYNPHFIRELTADAPEVAPGTRSGDGTLERPFIVFFGESVPMMDKAIDAAREADIFVVVGTSLVVYPAAGLLHFVRPDVPIWLIDPEDVKTDESSCIHFIKKGASEGMKELLTRLKEE